MLWWIGQSLVSAALLAGVVWTVCNATRIVPAARHALWLVVLIKLLTPPLVVWPWGVTDLIAKFDQRVQEPLDAQPIETVTPVEIAIAPPVAPTEPTASSSIAAPSLMPAELAPAMSEIREVHPQVIQQPARVQAWRRLYLQFGAIVWITGATAFALIQIVRIALMSRRLRSAQDPNAEVIEYVTVLSKRLHMRPIEARVVPGIGSPFIWAIVRPVLVWPAELPATMPRVAMEGLIVHELAHVKRRDHWVGWLELVAGCLWWWNPLFWYVRHQLRENAELACDAWVVGTLPAGRRAYAEALIAVCESVSRWSVPIPAARLSAGSRRAFERRLKMIAQGQTAFRLSRGALVVALVLAATALPAWSQLSQVPLEEPSFASSDGSLQAAEAELPEAAQRLFREYRQREVEAQHYAKAQAAERRKALLRELKSLQDRYATEGLLDEAVAVRAQIRALQPLTAISKPYGVLHDMTVYRGQEGARITLNVVGDTQGRVWGSNPYTDDSSLAAAAVHAGVLEPGERGAVTVKILPGAEAYEGSTKNGVTSSSYGQWAGSFRIDGAPTLDLAIPIGKRVRPDPGTLTQFRNRGGQTLAFRVTGSTDGTVWGSDVYTDDSSLATAAVHAGLLEPGEEGIVRATILPGLPRYEGSTENGVTTRSYGPWEGSFRLVEPEPVEASAASRYDSASDSTPRRSAWRPLKQSLPRGSVGESFQIALTGSTEGTVWGTDIYTDDSSLASAAVHAGVLRDGEHGVVLVTIVEGQPEYKGSTRNGVMSQEWGEWGGSFRIDPVEKVLEPARIPGGLLPDVDRLR
jgi:beta-lactamase regulating signal transducer with metallopeptidase domain